jgi:hypothetical protein
VSEPAVKKKQARAKRKAIERFRDVGYDITLLNDSVYSFIASRRRESRYVRVVVDRITPDDIKLVQGRELPDGCAREIFCQKETRFEIREVRE